MILWVYQKQLRGNAKTRSIKEDIIMKKKAARALAGVLTLSMAAALTACGGSDSAKKGGETAAAAESSGPITGQTLSVMLSEEPGEQDAL